MPSNTYFSSPQFTINFSNTLLYLSAYSIFSSTNNYSISSDKGQINVNFPNANLAPGAIWFLEDPMSLLNGKMTNNLRTNVLALSSSPSANVAFPVIGDSTTLSNSSAPMQGTTVLDGNPVLSDFAGSLYAVVRVVTKSPGITFTNFGDGGLSLNLIQNTVSSPFYGSSTNTTVTVASARAYLSSSSNPSWTYVPNISNLKTIGEYDVAEILFTIPAGAAQSQDTLDATTSFLISNISI